MCSRPYNAGVPRPTARNVAMKELNELEINEVDGGMIGLIIGGAAVYVGALTLVQILGTSSGEANARRTAAGQ